MLQRLVARAAALASVAFALALAAPSARAAVAEEDFYIKNAQDLVDLCSVKPDNSLAAQAIHFCEGFVSGAWQYHQAQANGPKGVRLVCPPDPPPTRDQAVGLFVTWAQEPANAQYMSEPAVETLFRFLVSKWPCPATGAEKEGSQ